MNGDDREGAGDGSNPLVRPPSSALCASLEAVVRGAGALAREAFGKPIKTWLKERGSPVTEIDMAVDALLRRELAMIAPDAGWLSEETPPAGLAAPRLWIVDPIDGTRAFIGGQPDWTVSVALVEAGRPIVAALYAPVTEEFFLAAAGAGARRNGIPISVSRGDAIAGARIAGPKSLLDRLGAVAPTLPPCRACIRWRCGSPASPTARSTSHLPGGMPATGTLRLPIFWCTKPAAR